MQGEIRNKLVVVESVVVVAADHSENNYITGCLLMVFVAVALPRLARNDMSFFKASLEGNSAGNLASEE